MATTTQQTQIVQKVGEDEFLLLHPETDSEVVLVESEKIQAKTVKGALEEIEQRIDNAIAGSVTSVNGKSGEVTIGKADVGLGKVDNTSDDEKPISAATQAELDKKATTDYVNTQLAKKANTGDIPDVSGFITKAVNDLVNYYTKGEVDQKISAIPKFKVSVVSVLPESGDDATIYLVKDTGEESQNLYVEYIWVSDAWEKLGAQKLDLSGYVTTEALNAAIEDFQTANDVNGLITAALTPYIKSTEVSSLGKSGSLADATDDETHRLVTDTEKDGWNEAKEKATTNEGAISDIVDGTTKVGKATQADSATSATNADAAKKLAVSKNFSISGDVTAAAKPFDGSQAVELAAVLSKTGVTAGSYSAVTVDEKGRVTAGANVVEVGEPEQETPSEKLAIGGIFFKRI